MNMNEYKLRSGSQERTAVGWVGVLNPYFSESHWKKHAEFTVTQVDILSP